MMSETKIKPPPLWGSVRFVLTLYFFGAVFTLYYVRFTMSMALVCMMPLIMFSFFELRLRSFFFVSWKATSVVFGFDFFEQSAEFDLFLNRGRFASMGERTRLSI